MPAILNLPECWIVPEQELWSCPSCDSQHELYRHDLSAHNSGSLRCPTCGHDFIRWMGTMFYTIADAEQSFDGAKPRCGAGSRL
jgi:transposase-like protein